MKRREFFSKTAMATIGSTVVASPMLSFVKSNVSIFKLEKGLQLVSEKTPQIHYESAPELIKKEVQKLIISFDEQGITYQDNLIQFNKKCFGLFIEKSSLFTTNEPSLVVITHNSITGSHYILNEKMTTEFNNLIVDFTACYTSYNLDLCAANFAFPEQVIAHKKGLSQSFSYKNKSGNTITLSSKFRKKANVHIG